MNWFKIPKYICKDIDTTNRSSFRNKNKDGEEANSAIPTIGLDKICRLKCEWGLDIKKTEEIDVVFQLNIYGKFSHKQITFW